MFLRKSFQDLIIFLIVKITEAKSVDENCTKNQFVFNNELTLAYYDLSIFIQ